MNFPLWFNSSSTSHNFIKVGWMGKLKLYQWTSINQSPTLKEPFTHMWFCNFQMLTNLIITMFLKKSQLVISTLISSRIFFWILGKYKAHGAIWRFFKILIFDSYVCVCVCVCVCCISDCLEREFITDWKTWSWVMIFSMNDLWAKSFCNK